MLYICTIIKKHKDMKTTKFEIKEAHSGTSKNEIRKAKRLFKTGVEKGKFQNAKNVGIVFTDINCKIHARYINIDSLTVIGEELI